MATPQFKVYDDGGDYVAATKDATLAAAVIGAAGDAGWTVKLHGRIIFREGQERLSAADTIDGAVEVMHGYIEQHQAERRARLGY